MKGLPRKEPMINKYLRQVENNFSCPLFNIYFFIYGLHLLLGNCIKSLDALKYSFYNIQKQEYLLNFVQKYSHETQIIQHLTYFGPTLDIEWHTLSKNGNFGIALVGTIQ